MKKNTNTDFMIDDEDDSACARQLEILYRLKLGTILIIEDKYCTFGIYSDNLVQSFQKSNKLIDSIPKMFNYTIISGFSNKTHGLTYIKDNLPNLTYIDTLFVPDPEDALPFRKVLCQLNPVDDSVLVVYPGISHFLDQNKLSTSFQHIVHKNGIAAGYKWDLRSADDFAPTTTSFKFQDVLNLNLPLQANLRKSYIAAQKIIRTDINGNNTEYNDAAEAAKDNGKAASQIRGFCRSKKVFNNYTFQYKK